MDLSCPMTITPMHFEIIYNLFIWCQMKNKHVIRIYPHSNTLFTQKKDNQIYFSRHILFNRGAKTLRTSITGKWRQDIFVILHRLGMITAQKQVHCVRVKWLALIKHPHLSYSRCYIIRSEVLNVKVINIFHCYWGRFLRTLNITFNRKSLVN